MLNNNQKRISPHIIGLIFLIFGLAMGVISLNTGTFLGGMMGFCLFAVPFGLILLFLPFPAEKK